MAKREDMAIQRLPRLPSSAVPAFSLSAQSFEGMMGLALFEEVVLLQARILNQVQDDNGAGVSVSVRNWRHLRFLHSGREISPLQNHAALPIHTASLNTRRSASTAQTTDAA